MSPNNAEQIEGILAGIFMMIIIIGILVGILQAFYRQNSANVNTQTLSQLKVWNENLFWTCKNGLAYFLLRLANTL
jgi:hypothetical protein